MRSRFVASALGVGMLCLASPASATSIDYGVIVTAVTGITFNLSGEVAGVDTIAPVSVNAPYGEAWGSVTDGVLHSYARYGGGFVGGTNFGAVSQYFDSITLHSNELAAGTEVQLAFHLNTHVTVSGCGGALTTASQAGLFINDEAGLPNFDTAVAKYGIQNCSLLYDVPDGIVTAKIGDTLLLRSLLSAAVVFDSSSSPAIVDASNSASYSITPLGNFSYTSLSGNTYPVVPEPTSILLVGSGVAGLVMRVRRRQR